MILPEGIPGVAFGDAADGDPRRDPAARLAISAAIGVDRFAWIDQVHGTRVVAAVAPGSAGEADAAYTVIPGLAVGVGTADCFPVALVGEGIVGVAHAGWRGAKAGVVTALRTAMRTAAGQDPHQAAIGPGIGPCCFEVGPEVAEQFPRYLSETTTGTRSVDLRRVLQDQLDGVSTWVAPQCTKCGDGWNSYRRDRTDRRQVALAWLPG
ncbi:MAG TPA: polyphenol oxidase family protein [Acidimicrobiia bacterium]|nr:polyphenol oxidase family protein [Acidimicrobiia bacterium]